MRTSAAIAWSAAVFVCLSACTTYESPARHVSVAELQQRIAPLLHTAPFVRIGSDDLRLDLPLRDAMSKDGLAIEQNGRWAFTAKAFAQSVACADRDPYARCFALVRDRFVRVVSSVSRPGTADTPPVITAVFSYRVLPDIPSAQHLARAGVLICGVAPGRTAPWRGASTLAQGVAEVSADGSANAHDIALMRDNFCPHTRLQDGKHTGFLLDEQKP